MCKAGCRDAPGFFAVIVYFTAICNMSNFAIKEIIMANIEQRAQVDIEVNSKSAQHKLAELSNKLDDLNKKKAAFEKAGDAKGMARMDTEIKKVEKSMNRVQTNAQKAEAAMKKLSKASPKELRAVLKQLQNDLEHIERGSDAWNRHVDAIKRVKAEIRTVDAELKEHQSLMDRIKGGISNWGMSFASAIAAFTGLTMAGRQAVEAYAEMEAEMANVRKYTGMTAEEVEHLNEAFKTMDTRTSREELNKLAQEAGRLGLQSEEDVLGFVKAADVINVALDDLGEGATLTLSKLTDIFGDKQALGVEQSLLSVGSVINELSQNCTASAPYLANFAQRLAGVGKQAGMTIPQIMGFAAVLDSQGQAVEMSATALSQLITKLFQDPAKIAQATGMELSKFNAVLKKDTNEALIMLLEQLNRLGDLSSLAPVFQSMGTDGARASAVIAALAGNVDQVKQQQLAANKAYKEGTSVLNEFAVQNNTVQAQLDKAKKGFHELMVEIGQRLAPAMKVAIEGTSLFLKSMMSLLGFIGNHIGVIISTATAIGIYTVAVNASVIADKIKHLWTEKLVAGFKKLWKVVAANPWAAFAVAVGAVVGVLIDLWRSTNAVAEAQKALNDIRTKAAQKMVEEQQHIETLMAAAQNMNLTYAEQQAAVNELNKIIPGFNGKINATTREFTYSKDALKKYNDELMRLYELEGAREALRELGEKRARLLIEKRETEAAIEREKANVPATRPQTSQGNVAPGGVNAAVGHSTTLATLNMTLGKVNKELDVVDKTFSTITSEFGTDLQRQAVTPRPPVTTPESHITRPETEAERKAREKAEKEAERERKQEEREAERERKEKEREEKRKQEEARRVRIQQYAEARDHARLMAEMEYNNLGNDEAWQNQALLNKKRFDAEKQYLEKVRDEYDKDTDERARAEKDLARAIQEEKLRIAKQTEEDLATWSLAYQQMSARRRIELEEATIDTLAENEVLSTEEAERAKAAIRKRYRDELNGKTGTTAKNQGMTDAADAMNAQMDELEAAYAAGLITEEDYQSRRWQIIKNYHDKVAGLISGEGSEWASMVVNFQQALTSALDNLGSTWEEKLKSITDITQAAFAIMGAGLQQYTAYAAAERDLEVAKVTASYDKQIEAAGKNSKRAQQLEKKKQKDIAKIKSDYNKKAQTIEIAQAIASTAMAAINAYASASKVSWILGPIAAAMATAAGMMQIATIRKQHQAEAAGYYEGGFTRRDKDNRQEVGVVHANEFVANHEAVANPSLAPVLRMIDEAQRNNTVGSLSADDVSRAIGQGRILGQTVAAQQQLVAHGDQGLAVVAASVQEQKDAIDQLRQAIDDGIEAYVVMDGERGLDKQYKRYQRLINNPKR